MLYRICILVATPSSERHSHRLSSAAQGPERLLSQRVLVVKTMSSETQIVHTGQRKRGKPEAIKTTVAACMSGVCSAFTSKGIVRTTLERHLCPLHASYATHRHSVLTPAFKYKSSIPSHKSALLLRRSHARRRHPGRQDVCPEAEQGTSASTSAHLTGRSLSLALLITVVACQALSTRYTPKAAEALLLLLDVSYAGLHLHPLLPLFQRHGKPDMAFMQSYTRPLYFISECWLLAWLLQTPVIQDKVPLAVLTGHGAVHVLFVILAGVAADWAMQQQVQRIQNGWNVKGLSGVWHTLVNLVNFADLMLHCCYIAILWQSTAQLVAPTTQSSLLVPTSIVVAGLSLSYVTAAVLPHCLSAKASQ